VLIRTGSPADVAALADLMFADPPREAVVLAGGAENGRRFELHLLDQAVRAPGSVVLVATDQDEPLGFAWLSDGSDVSSLRQVAATAVRAMGLRAALAAAWAASSRLAVDMQPPEGGRNLTELHVHPDHRGRGIGGDLLRAVEEHARREGAAHVSLTTASTNPARRLYERHGFEVVRERSGRRYARLTGIPGRVMMLKALDSA
jgi:ribosomal protein S18 acetylase RimI-like enzyme